MRLLSWLGGSGTDPSRRTKCVRSRGRRPAGRPLAVEFLDDRTLPSFFGPVNYPAGAAPQAVVTADLNGDGKLDLATADYYSGVSVLLGNGDGTFRPALTSATGYGARSLAVGDFNADGKLDVATADSYDVSVLLGNGDGTFQAPSSLGVSGNPQSVAVGDFDGDGKMDLGVASSVYVIDGYYQGYYGGWYSYGHNEGQANVLLGDGGGGFSGPNVTDLGSGSVNTAAAADLDGDGLDDFVTVNEDYGYVDVLLGDAGGYLQGPSTYSTGDYAYSVAVGDVSADGRTDLVVAKFYGNSVAVLLGDGAGGFAAAANYPTGGYPTGVVLGDFTGDGRVDVATANYYSNNVSVLYGGGDGTFSTAADSPTGSNPFRLAAGEFSGDGRLDAVTVNAGGGDVSVLVNDHFWPPPPPVYVSINDVTVTEGNTGTTTATFTVTLSVASGQPITVHFATAAGTATAGSDFTAASGDVTIPAGQTSWPVTVAVLGDRAAEPTETFAVNLSTSEAFIRDGQGVGTILDDEPRVSIGDATVTEGNTGSVNATFIVSLSFAYDAPVTVHFATAAGTATAGSDFTAASGDVTIPAGQTSWPVTVAVLGDRAAEPTETFAVNLSSPTNAGIADDQGVGTIIDNEPRIGINSVSKKEGNGGTVQFVFTVSLSAAYDQAVTVSYATANGTATAGSDYQAKSGTLTFAAGVTSMTITINVLPDKTREADETFFVNLSGASGNALIGVAQGRGLILDDDLPPGKKK